MVTTRQPRIIQGGMGIAVSSWPLARAVSVTGQLGVVSGTALDTVLARRLQDGDPEGDSRRAMAAFPIPWAAAEVLDRFFRVRGRAASERYAPASRPSLNPDLRTQRLLILASFVEVWLAKENHRGSVGINYLEKIQMSTPYAVYGAMLADVDVVLMGAGIPAHIPRLLNDLATHTATELAVDVEGAGPGQAYAVRFDPREALGADLPPVHRPTFLAIVASHVLAAYLARDEATRPDGFIVEGPTAGGHNAPPRGALTVDDLGQPVYGQRDVVDTSKLAALDLPFWLAGSYGTPENLRVAESLGACGVQVGTLFAMCRESGLTPALREQMLTLLGRGELHNHTDAHASPTGFPFKVASLPGTLSDPAVRRRRQQLCDLGHLRTPFIKLDGAVDYRCPAEPAAMYARKGGDPESSEGRVCLCNALSASVGLGQTAMDGSPEPAIVTLGDDLVGASALLAAHPDGWSAQQAVTWLLN
ncbi:unannotated protein [freshwater metagenome]|uniref:Unannotated protein n=1 Tax=freshwater metagenome TaxID=449393 RepID=A0A6J7SBE4_9ZZZZ|nr:nitronate monooxygenase [Actinomycetota bacterium]MSW36431.1 nitronate monooxygenase [Actinomycetota bacterium]